MREAARAFAPPASVLTGRIFAAYALQRAAALFGRELTFKQSFSLLSSAATVVSTLDPARLERVVRQFERSDVKRETKLTITNDGVFGYARPADPQSN